MAKQMNFVSINTLSSEDKSKLKSVITEINDSLTRMAAERDLQKDMINKVGEDLGIDKKLVRKLAKSYFKSNFNNEVVQFEEYEEFYRMLFQGGNATP